MAGGLGFFESGVHDNHGLSAEESVTTRALLQKDASSGHWS